MQDPLLVIDVVQEQIERADPLPHAGLDGPPVRSRQHPGNDVERQDAVDGVAIRIDREGDAEVEQLVLGGLGAPTQLGEIHLREASADLRGVRRRRLPAAVHLAPEAVVTVARKRAGRSRDRHSCAIPPAGSLCGTPRRDASVESAAEQEV